MSSKANTKKKNTTSLDTHSDSAKDTANFTTPDSLKHHYVIVPSKLRLVTLAAFVLWKAKVRIILGNKINMVTGSILYQNKTLHNVCSSVHWTVLRLRQYLRNCFIIIYTTASRDILYYICFLTVVSFLIHQSFRNFKFKIVGLRIAQFE